MHYHLFVVLLAAAASARPMPTPRNVANVARELEYSKIAALSPPPTMRHGDKHYAERDPEHPHHHPEDRHPHGPPPPLFDERSPYPHPHDLHKFEEYPHDHEVSPFKLARAPIGQ